MKKWPWGLHRMVPWAHRLLDEVLSPGDLAVDLTVGNGGDTLFLYRCVGATGQVVGFDVQEEALAGTAVRLQGAGAPVCRLEREKRQSGVLLVREDHRHLKQYCHGFPKGIIANLGFLPGGDRAIRTRPDSSVQAVESALDLLSPGGRLVTVLYVGHEGGMEEARRIEALFAQLQPKSWSTLRLDVPGRDLCPFVLAAEKR